MASLTDVAKRAGVALDTARRALQGKSSVRAKTLERVVQAAKELDYQPNLLAKALKENRLNIVPISIVGMDKLFFGKLAQDISESLVAVNLEPALCSSPGHLLHMHKALATAGSILVNGLDLETVGELSKTQKVVTINSCVPTMSGVCDILIDFDPIYAQATEAVLQTGRNKIACCSEFYLNSLRNNWPLQKFNAVFDTLDSAGLQAVAPSDAPLFGNEKELALWLVEHPDSIDAVFCDNDLAAGQLLAEFASHGIKTPDDILIIGCDGNYILPGMWSIRVDTRWLATTATDVLQRMLGGETLVPSQNYKPELVNTPAK